MSSDQNQNYRRTPRDPQQQDSPPALPRINITSLPSLRFVVPRGRDSITIPARDISPATNGGRRYRIPTGPSRQRNSQRNSSLSRFYTDHRPHHAGQSWEEANAHLHLRAILEQAHSSPLFNAVTYGSTPDSTQQNTNMASSSQRRQESQEDNRRVKRRKVDVDRLVPDFEGFRYGTYGQVEPGTLTMEIVSCDGGMFLNERSYAAENILRNDASVYCTKGNRCNIVLRHQGATVFNLTELIIKAPGSNYSSPVRQGMVFVSMHHDDRLARTAQYQIQYGTRPRVRRSSADSEDRAQHAGLRGVGAPAMAWRRRDTAAEVRRRNSYYNLGLEYDRDEDDDEEDEEEEEDGEEEQDDDGEDSEDEEHRFAQMPREFSTTALPTSHITTECSDDEAIEPFIVSRSAPNRIGILPFESDSEDSFSNGIEEPFLDDLAVFSLGDISSSLGESGPPAAGARTATQAQQSSIRGPSTQGELMAPHAKFNIDKGRSKCTIHFDPPISGRFILLKMWSPHHDPASNIDIQTVMAKGFAGPRYFPSISLL
ncbi:hypothetical protein jhhlp_001224 [Lomentospora prolificans]|uniref:Uncharacterized protein n=1 Tax=Lomentospora prolificans TaxID=41688 RepID=A0A2N3NHI2_9PEZI|nr:hypothetical protein jhhlp_001224 [Lomentospora prolificans]